MTEAEAQVREYLLAAVTRFEGVAKDGDELRAFRQEVLAIADRMGQKGRWAMNPLPAVSPGSLEDLLQAAQQMHEGMLEDAEIMDAEALRHEAAAEAPRETIYKGPEKKRVFLALPRHSTMEAETAKAVYVWASRDRLAVTVHDRVNSLLAYAFNLSWCDALNAGGFDYWSILHSDVAPSQWWLDVLADEMDAHDLDVIHAVSPIKDHRGLTSTAVGRVDDPWTALRRLTTGELRKLPETFTVGDVLRELPDTLPRFFQLAKDRGDQLEINQVKDRLCLLPNTGCMLVRLKPKQVREPGGADEVWPRCFPGFTIDDRVLENDVGTMVAGVASEDWNYGRWLAQRGMKVGATTKVVINHLGSTYYPNNTSWGSWSRDEAWASGEPG